MKKPFSSKKRKYTWEEFLEIFKPRRIPRSSEEDPEYFFETYDEDYETVRKVAFEDKEHTDFHNVWTLIDDDGKWYIVPGIRYVNRMNYLICDVPWTDEQDARGIYVKY